MSGGAKCAMLLGVVVGIVITANVSCCAASIQVLITISVLVIVYRR